jgi:Uma2 family endonuclease
MIDLLTKPGFQKRAVPLSVKVWHEMIAGGMVPKRSELIRGVIVEKMPKSKLHVNLVRKLVLLLRFLENSGFCVFKEDPLTLADSEPEPDVSVVEEALASLDQHASTARLVIEVAVTTLEEDREMADIYAEAGVQEFWIVNAKAQNIEVYRQPTSSGYLETEIVSLGQTLKCTSLPDVEVNVGQLFEGVPQS